MRVSSATKRPTEPVWSYDAVRCADGRILESSVIRHAGRSTARAIPIQSSDRDSPQYRVASSEGSVPSAIAVGDPFRSEMPRRVRWTFVGPGGADGSLRAGDSWRPI